MSYHFTQLILEFLSSISWPLVAALAFFSLKNPIRNFINNIKKIGYGNTGIETNFINNQEDENSIIDSLGDGNDFSYIDALMAKFSESTLAGIDQTIQNETLIDSVEGIQNKYERIYKYAKLLVIIKNGERIYSSIYGSQIRLLQRLNHSNTETKAELKLYYDNAANSNPNVYQNYSYESYLSYLANNQLIKIENENISITDSGRDFLRYILEANLSVEKLF